MILNGKYRLDPIAVGDLEFARTLRNTPCINKYLSNTDNRSKEQQLNWYLNEYVPTANQQRFVVMRKQEKIGFVSLSDINLRNEERSAYAGIFMSQKNWGSHAADMSLALLAEYVFRGLCLETVVARIIKENKSTINLARRMGCIEITAQEFAKYSTPPIDGAFMYFKYLRTNWKENASIKINANHELINLAAFPKPVPDSSQILPSSSA